MQSATRSLYPISLNVSGRAVLVVGGGPVAARRALSLLGAGAQVTVVAPYVCEDLRHLAAEGALQWYDREYDLDDLEGMWLAHTATGDREVDDEVARDADAARVWCVRADDARESAAWTPAVARVDDVTIAVTTNADPKRAVRLRNAVQTSLETGDLPLRHRRRGVGRVALVGGGPGDPGLITTRGRRLLAEADVVIVDRLAPWSLLDELDSDVEVVDVGKVAARSAVSQDEINALLIEHARAGKRVVRLKGGDPFVLGRGAEEALACVDARVECEVVPGVTSALAVPAVAGIPVTHRGLARAVTIVTAHTGSGHSLDWDALARTGGTLVILMGVSSLGDSTEALLGAGLAGRTPAAVVENGTTPQQRVTTGTLETIAGLAVERGVQAPAVVVIGDVVSLHEILGVR